MMNTISTLSLELRKISIFRSISIYTLIILVIILSGCSSQKIVPEDFTDKEVVVSPNAAQLETGGEVQLFIGVNNKEKSKQIFDIIINCENCEENSSKITAQYFPVVEIDAETKAAFPFLITSKSDAEEREYEFKVIVEKIGEINTILGEEILRVNVIDVVSRKKEELGG